MSWWWWLVIGWVILGLFTLSLFRVGTAEAEEEDEISEAEAEEMTRPLGNVTVIRRNGHDDTLFREKP